MKIFLLIAAIMLVMAACGSYENEDTNEVEMYEPTVTQTPEPPPRER